MKWLGWVRRYRNAATHGQVQEHRDMVSLPEVDHALAFLQSAARPPAGLEDRVLARVVALDARHRQSNWRLVRRIAGDVRGVSSRTLNLGLAAGVLCVAAVLTLGGHVSPWDSLLRNRQAATSPSIDAAEQPAARDSRIPMSQTAVRSLGLAAARREPPRPVATGSRSGRGSLLTAHKPLHGRARKSPAP